MKKAPAKTTRKSAFLAAFAICGRIKDAAAAAKVKRDMHYRWLEQDPAYPALFEKSRRMAIQAWEDEAVLRATEGVFEPCTYQGQFVFPVIGHKVDPKTKEQVPLYGKVPFGIWKKSDRLLEFLLRGAKPETYRERTSVDVKADVKTEHKFVGTMTELLQTYRELAVANDDEEES